LIPVELLTSSEVIAAFIAALVGSFLGAFFNESVSQYYYKRRRKREIPPILLRDVTLLFSLIAKRAGMGSVYRIYKERQKFAYEWFKKNPRDSKEYSVWETENRIAYEQMANLHKEEGEIRDAMDKLYSSTLALGMESKLYFKTKTNQALIQLIRELEFEQTKRVLDGFEKFTYDQLVDFHIYEYGKELAKLTTQITASRDYYLDRITEILEKSLR
jgi:hypothetical protein